MKIKVLYESIITKVIEVDDRFEDTIKTDAEIAAMTAEEYAEWDNLTEELHEEAGEVVDGRIFLIADEKGNVIAEW